MPTIFTQADILVVCGIADTFSMDTLILDTGSVRAQRTSPARVALAGVSVGVDRVWDARPIVAIHMATRAVYTFTNAFPVQNHCEIIMKQN